MTSIGKLIGRYWVVVLLPSFVVSTIYADYTRTQEWKRIKALKED